MAYVKREYYPLVVLIEQPLPRRKMDTFGTLITFVKQLLHHTMVKKYFAHTYVSNVLIRLLSTKQIIDVIIIHIDSVIDVVLLLQQQRIVLYLVFTFLLFFSSLETSKCTAKPLLLTL